MPPAPLDWRAFALLLIDVQNDFWPRKFSQSFPQFPEHTAQLLSFCRAQGLDIIHLRAGFNPDRSNWMARYKLRHKIPCIEGTPGAAVLPFAQPLPGEIVITKHAFDGFLTPQLLPHLRQANKRFLLTAGLITSTCVLFTTVSAMQNGFLTAVVEDCCADDPDRHAQTLSAYPYIFSRTTLAQLPSQHARWLNDLQTLAGSDS